VNVAPILLGVLGLAAVSYALAQVTRGPTAQSSAGLSVQAAPLTRSIAPGDTASFTIRIHGARRGKVTLGVVDGLPPGATASFSPNATRKSTATLTVDTAGAPSGGRRLRLLARSGARRRATAAVNLVITSAKGIIGAGPGGESAPGGSNFSISGSLPGVLAPGVTQPLDLALANPGTEEISISSLLVSIGQINAPQSDATHPCSLDDFSVAQLSGAYGFKVGPSQTRTLSELGFPEEEWPQVTMLDRAVNQDGCKGASLTFSYTGSGTGGN
jgi:hypothetical protein